jgi:GNAT superfamily N-acetyltransferase
VNKTLSTIRRKTNVDDDLNIRSLDAEDEGETVTYLARRPVRAAYLLGLIHDNGIASPRNRGAFYACLDGEGKITGVALIGHAIQIEADDERAVGVFARFARKLPVPRLIRGRRSDVAAFWRQYSDEEQPFLLKNESLLALKTPARIGVTPPLRRATSADLPLLVEVNASMISDECGKNPLECDPEGFRRRLSERIARGRVWVWREADRLVFKADVLADTHETVYIEGVYVSPEERGRGVGMRGLSRMCGLLLERAQSVCLTANEFDRAALSLYRRAGFELSCEYATIYPQPAGQTRTQGARSAR